MPTLSSFCEVQRLGFAVVHEETIVSLHCRVSRHFCLLFLDLRLVMLCHQTLPPSVCCSACGLEAQRIDEMEKMLKEAQQEKARLIENRVSSQLQRSRVFYVNAVS